MTPHGPAVVRAAGMADLPQLARVELEAAARFDNDPAVAHLCKETVPPATIQRAQSQSLVWVASRDGHGVVGFLIAERLDQALHITEMGVVPSHGRKGLGATLLGAVCARSRQTGCRGVTLTTFASVPWNAPFYAKNGFRPMAAVDIGPELSLRIEQERALGLVDRVAMWRPG